jgi:lipopolysaccharide transport system ATP-binding protein
LSTVIRVEDLGKSYRITRRNREPYSTLRDVLAQSGRSLVARLRHPFSGALDADGAEQFWALRELSFEVRQGDRIGVIGRNGAGKSTLLKLLSRITEPTIGRISLKGRVASLLEVGTGFHPELTGRENIFLNGSILGMSKQEIRRKFDEIVAFAEVERFLDTPVKRYSSGMYVRLAFSVAAHLEPEILIVDEVLAVGDAQFQQKCLGKMEDVGNEGRTVLFVSHNMGSINRLCSRCLLLDKGQLVASGDNQSVIRQYLSNSSSATMFELPQDPEREMSLRRVMLNPDRTDRSAEIRYDEPLTIRVEYDVNSPVDNCTVWIGIQTMEGVIAFCTADHDTNPEMLRARAPGHYQADIAIPAKWLNAGEYNVIVGVVRNNPVVVYNREETLTFSVLDVGTPGSVLREGVRKGVLQPILEWTHARQ